MVAVEEGVLLVQVELAPRRCDIAGKDGSRCKEERYMDTIIIR